MRKVMVGDWTRRQFFGGVAAAAVVGEMGWSGKAAMGQTNMTADSATRALMAGNERFAAGKIRRFSAPC